jgi:hypothetical protein
MLTTTKTKQFLCTTVRITCYTFSRRTEMRVPTDLDVVCVRSFVRNSVRWALLKWELVVARLTIGRWGEGVVVGELPSSVWRTADAFLKEFHHPLPSAPLPLHLKTRALPLCSASSRFEFNPKTTSGC